MNQHWETAQRFNKDFEAGQYDYIDKGLQQFQKASNKLLNIEQVFLKYHSLVVIFRNTYPFSQKESVSFIVKLYNKICHIIRRILIIIRKKKKEEEFQLISLKKKEEVGMQPLPLHTATETATRTLAYAATTDTDSP